MNRLKAAVPEGRKWCRSHAGTAYSFEEYLDVVRDFHGHVAPGLLIGGKMVDVLLSRMSRDILFDVICETDNCLPDAVQLLTLCTTGNGWMKVVPLQRFAITFYDKYEGEGVRVYLDPVRLDHWEEIKNWFFQLVPKADQNGDRLREQIRAAGDDILGLHGVRVDPRYLGRKKSGRKTTCPVCGEAYPISHGKICRGCEGRSPYISVTDKETV